MKNTTYFTIEIAAPRQDVLHWGSYGWQADHLAENGCIFETREAAEAAAEAAANSSLYPMPDGFGEIQIVENEIENEA